MLKIISKQENYYSFRLNNKGDITTIFRGECHNDSDEIINAERRTYDNEGFLTKKYVIKNKKGTIIFQRDSNQK
ncbi:hypothetical protein AAEX28_09770 [Lentisphaerota bacterium WC36G]|nr:hypothetical protein LJT99_12605 [Lentisphaerae bacterium WC36]